MATQTEKPIYNSYNPTQRSLDPNLPENLHLDRDPQEEFNDLLRAVRVRFDTNPRFYQKEDYTKLIDLVLRVFDSSISTDNLNTLDSELLYGRNNLPLKTIAGQRIIGDGEITGLLTQGHNVLTKDLYLLSVDGNSPDEYVRVRYNNHLNVIGHLVDGAYTMDWTITPRKVEAISTSSSGAASLNLGNQNISLSATAKINLLGEDGINLRAGSNEILISDTFSFKPSKFTGNPTVWDFKSGAQRVVKFEEDKLDFYLPSEFRSDVRLSSINEDTPAYILGVNSNGYIVKTSNAGGGSSGLDVYHVALGQFTSAIGRNTVAAGFETEANGDQSHSEGWYSIANGTNSHTEGNNTRASGANSHAEGFGGSISLFSGQGLGDNILQTYYQSEGSDSSLSFFYGSDYYSDSDSGIGELYLTEKNNKLHGWLGRPLYDVDGNLLGNIQEIDDGTIVLDRLFYYDGPVFIQTGSTGANSHSEGFLTDASGVNSHSEGEKTRATGTNAHSEGYATKAFGMYSHAEGNGVEALAMGAHSEGYRTHSEAPYSHVEGYDTKTGKEYSHAEGFGTDAKAVASHAEGYCTETNGSYSHSEGGETNAQAAYSHAEGYKTHAFEESYYVNLTEQGVIIEVSSSNFALYSVGEMEFLGYTCQIHEEEYPYRIMAEDVSEIGDTTFDFNDSIFESPWGLFTDNGERFLGLINSYVLLYHLEYNKVRQILFDFVVDMGLIGVDNMSVWWAPLTEIELPLTDVEIYITPKYYYERQDDPFYYRSVFLPLIGTHLTSTTPKLLDINFAGIYKIQRKNYAIGMHAEGNMTEARHSFAHTEGNRTIARNIYEHAQGSCNRSHHTSEIFGDPGNTIFSVGVGNEDRQNAIEIMQNGDVYIKGIGGYDGDNISTASSLLESFHESLIITPISVDQINSLFTQ